MKQIHIINKLEQIQRILKQVQNEIQRLHSQEEGLDRIAQDLLKIKDNTIETLKLVQAKKEGPPPIEKEKEEPQTLKIEGKIHSLTKTKK